MFKQFKLAIGLAITATLVACGGGGDSGGTPQQTPTVVAAKIDATGGTASTNDSAASVTFPANAFNKSTTVTIAPITNIPTSERLVTDTAWEFGPSGAFAKPATLSLKYNPSKIPTGALENYLAIHTIENGAWVPVQGSVVDTARKLVSAPISHFSGYAVLANNQFAATYDGTYTSSNYPGSTFYWTAIVDNSGRLSAVIDGGATSGTGSVNFSGQSTVQVGGTTSSATNYCPSTFTGVFTLQPDGRGVIGAGTWQSTASICVGYGQWSGRKIN